MNTRGHATILGKKPRTNVATSREQKALFFVGHESFWKTQTQGHSAFMGKILKDCFEHAAEISPYPFVVNSLGDDDW